MKAPVAGLARYGSHASGCVRLSWTWPTSLSPRRADRPVLQGVDVDAVAERRDLGRHLPRGLLQRVRPAGHERLLGHPDHRRLDLAGDLRQVVGVDQHVAPADVHLVGQRDRHRLGRERDLQLAVVGHDRLDAAPLARGENHHLVEL